MSRKHTVIAITTVLGVLFVTSACGAGSSADAGPSASTASQPSSFAWGGDVPGRKVELDLTVYLAAAATGGTAVRPESIREVVAAGAGEAYLSLLAASTESGEVCFSLYQARSASSFGCPDDFAGDSAVVARTAAGGSDAGTVDWLSLVGIARDDIEGVVLGFESGATVQLALNEWRAFGYSSSPLGDRPVSLRGLGAGGAVVETVELAPQTPPCSGLEYEACVIPSGPTDAHPE